MAERIATSLGLTGWVSNLHDGRVEVFAEGREKELRDFLLQINKKFKGYVHSSNIIWGEPTGEFDGFDIRNI